MDDVTFNLNSQYIQNTNLSLLDLKLNEFQTALLFMNKTPSDLALLEQKMKYNDMNLESTQLNKFIEKYDIDEDIIFIHAPTGTGKTLGFLLPTLSSSRSNFSGRIKTIITEPTNAIISELYEDIGEESKKIGENIKYTKITGKDKNKNRLFGIPEALSENDIILTNIDIISLYVAGRYLDWNLRHLSKQKALQWSDMFKKISLFIIDEYHAYDEESLGKIIALILISKYTHNKVKFIFASATPNRKFIEILKGYKISIREININSSGYEINSRKFRGNLRLIFTSRKLLEENVEKNVRETVMYMFDHKIDAENFIYKLKQKGIFPREYTGYANREIKNNNTNINQNVIVATNAGELGININPDIEHIEPGKYYENFWQRLGRTARGTDGTIYVHIEEQKLKVLNEIEKTNEYTNLINEITNKLSLNSKDYIAKRCKMHLSGFLYSIYRNAGNSNLKAQIKEISTLLNMTSFFNLEKLIHLVKEDNDIKENDKDNIIKWIENTINNLGYFRGIINNVKVKLPDGKNTTEDYIYLNMHTRFKKDGDYYEIKEFLDKSENINITYSGLGNIPISIGNKDIYDKDKFAQKFKENFQYFLDDYDNCSQYLKLMNALYDPYFISVRLFIPEGVVVENDENIFL